MPTAQDKLFCQLAVKLGFLTVPAAQEALGEAVVAERDGQPRPITEILQLGGQLTRDQIREVAKAVRDWTAKHPGPAGSEPPPPDPALAATLAGPVPEPSATPPPSMPGTVGAGSTLGKYTLVRKLGQGAMGVVYEATQAGVSRRAAVKVLAHGLITNERVVARFRREAEAAARLTHPGIVAIFGMGSHEGVHYIAMEYVDGTTLDELLEKERLTPQRVAEIVAAAADALHYAHENGVIHRDIKPTNLMMDKERRVLVADFGLARPEGASRITGAGQLLGTPAYMAPEQAAGEHESVDRRTDVYSLGATLYEMLTLRAPFEGRGVFEVLKKVLDEEPQDPCAVTPTAPRPLANIALKAMAKVADHRYGTAADMREDLKRFLRGESPIASGRSHGTYRAPGGESIFRRIAARLRGK
ncbi:MAG: serine/threonine protein kinase [Planctomycetales bacterium]|nr:serine/threonine protein kinase [Planctomycetales bacterium]